MFQGILFYFASGKALFVGQKIIDSLIDTVKMPLCIRALLRIALRMTLKTDLLLAVRIMLLKRSPFCLSKEKVSSATVRVMVLAVR